MAAASANPQYYMFLDDDIPKPKKWLRISTRPVLSGYWDTDEYYGTLHRRIEPATLEEIQACIDDHLFTVSLIAFDKSSDDHAELLSILPFDKIQCVYIYRFCSRWLEAIMKYLAPPVTFIETIYVFSKDMEDAEEAAKIEELLKVVRSWTNASVNIEYYNPSRQSHSKLITREGFVDIA